MFKVQKYVVHKLIILEYFTTVRLNIKAQIFKLMDNKHMFLARCSSQHVDFPLTFPPFPRPDIIIF
jgi:hypothetical protein